MRVLDDEVGEDRWVMALTGDHGVMGMPEHLAEEGVSRPAVPQGGTRRAPTDLRGAPGDGWGG